MKHVWRRFVGGVLALGVVFTHTHTAWAYESLRQSDWSGGYGQQVWSDSTKFNEYYHVKYGKELTIPGNDTWYDSAWKYRRRIEIDNTEQGELDHFPVLVVLEHKVNIDYLKAQSDDGYDLRFTDSDGTTVIPYDVERWDQGGKSYIWVKIPQIKDHGKDYFYMYYGNPQAVDARDPEKVWDNEYVFVHHLSQAPKNNETYNDSTNVENNGTMTGQLDDSLSQVEGKFGSGQEFRGVPTMGVDIADTEDTIDFSQPFTISFWIYPKILTGTFFDNRENGTTGEFTARFNTSSPGQLLIARQNVGNILLSNSVLQTDRWYKVTVTGNPTTFTWYVNGSFDGSTTTTAYIDTTSRIKMGNIWSSPTSTAAIKGIIDEARLEKVSRSSDWIKAEYKSETNTYLTFGNEELFGSELVSSIFDAGHQSAPGSLGWGYLAYEAEEPEKTAAKVKVRTGQDMYLADAPDFTTCESIINKTDISNNKCVRDGDRYIQYQVILESTEVNKTPIFKEISITDFLAHPVVKGISTVAASPRPTLENLEFTTPKPMSGPSPQQKSMSNEQETGLWERILNVLEAIVK